MFAFGVAISDESTYRRQAAPGIGRAREPDSVVLERRGYETIQEPYDAMLDEASRLPGLEGLILLHQDLEIRDDRFLARVRHVLADERVAVVGSTGTRGVRSIAWWDAPEAAGQLVAPGLLGERVTVGRPVEAPETVDSVDGSLLALSPWAVRNLRFDPAFADVFHGYDVDFCFEARRRGRLVAVTNLEVAHHPEQAIRNRRRWVLAYARFAAKWRRPE